MNRADRTVIRTAYVLAWILAAVMAVTCAGFANAVLADDSYEQERWDTRAPDRVKLATCQTVENGGLAALRYAYRANGTKQQWRTYRDDVLFEEC